MADRPPRHRRRFIRYAAVFAALGGAVLWVGAHRPLPVPTGPRCAITGAGTLRVCHDPKDEGVFYRPGPWQIGYNTQVIALGGGRYATVLHSEARDQERYRAATGGVRPGDSIKSGVVDASADPKAALAAPHDLDFRIWGTLDNPRSPLFYAFDPSRLDRPGISGGANPMVVRGSADRGDPGFQMFFLGVVSDGGAGAAWRNVLLQARTTDFARFDVLTRGADGAPAWAPFTGAEVPAIVEDTEGRPIQSNQPADVETGDSKDKLRPRGAVVTAGVFGSVVRVGGRVHYFYTDQDPADPARNHLYVRTADDISTDRRWSPPRIVLDIPPEIMVRVTKAADMDRWMVVYTCLRSLSPFISDLCLQYTGDLSLDGPAGLGGLQLFDGPTYTGVSRHALGLIGGNREGGDGSFIKGQQFYLSDPDGGLVRPPGAGPAVGGLLTWIDLPRNLAIFGAATDWGTWEVTPVTPPSLDAPPG